MRDAVDNCRIAVVVVVVVSAATTTAVLGWPVRRAKGGRGRGGSLPSRVRKITILDIFQDIEGVKEGCPPAAPCPAKMMEKERRAEGDLRDSVTRSRRISQGYISLLAHFDSRDRNRDLNCDSSASSQAKACVMRYDSVQRSLESISRPNRVAGRRSRRCSLSERVD